MEDSDDTVGHDLALIQNNDAEACRDLCIAR